MRTWVMALVLAAATSWASDVRVGDALDAVLAALGQPQGYIRSGDYVLLAYERGRVELNDNRVVRADLVSAEEAERQRMARLRREAQRREAAALRRAQLIVEGTGVRDRKLADPLFAVSHPQEQVSFWQAFRRSYPDVDVTLPYAEALGRLETLRRAEALDSERRRQIAELEDRVAAAEDRARVAELQIVRCGYPYGSWWYAPGWVTTGGRSCDTRSYYRETLGATCAPLAARCAPRVNAHTRPVSSRCRDGITIGVQLGAERTSGRSSGLTFVSHL
jgi:hypothetical protein